MSASTMSFTNATVVQSDSGWHATCHFWDADGIHFTWTKDHFKDHVAAKAWVAELKESVSTWRPGTGLAEDAS